MASRRDATYAPEENYHRARQVGPGRWFYTCRSQGRVWPIGYCTPDCYHLSATDAERHYREFLLDSAQFSGRWSGKMKLCEVCGTWTEHYAVLKSYVAYPLCHAHLSREGLAQLQILN